MPNSNNNTTGDSKRCPSRVRSRGASETLSDRPLVLHRFESSHASASGTGTRFRSVPPNTVAGWQYTSSSRCLVCGKLGCCGCGVRLDPELRRQKLESLRRSTPYERAKWLRATEGVRTEEVRRRERIAAQWVDWVQRSFHLERVERTMATTAECERHARSALTEKEDEERTHLWSLTGCHKVIMALQSNEREARLAVEATERGAYVLLTQGAEWTRRLAHIAQHESFTREAIQFDEAGARDRLTRYDMDLRNQLSAFALEQQQLICAYSGSRDAVVHEWKCAVEKIAELAAFHRHSLQAHAAMRASMCVAAERAAFAIYRQEDAAWCRLLEERSASAALLERRRLRQIQEQEALQSAESAARFRVEAAATAAGQQLVAALKVEEEERYEMAMLHAEQREREWHFAQANLQAVVLEESEQRRALCARAAEEADRRHEWIAAKESARRAYFLRCAAEKAEVRQEERHARMQLYKVGQQAEVAVLNWMKTKARQLDAVWITVTAQRTELERAEHATRFAVVSQMAQEEEQLRRLLEDQQQAQLALLEQEAECRSSGYQLEEAKREELRWACTTTAEMLVERARHHAEQRANLAREYLDTRAGLAEQSCVALGGLRQLCERERVYVVAAIHHRNQLMLQRLETVQRSLILREEVDAFGSLTTRITFSFSYLAEEAKNVFRRRLFEVDAGEQHSRELIQQQCAAGYEQLNEYQRREVEDIQRVEKERQLAALRVREETALEDARLYDDSELLSFPAGENSPVPAPAAEPLSTTETLKRELVLQCLGHPECSAPLSATAVNTLAAIIDVVNVRRDGARGAVQTAEKKAAVVARQVRRQEEIIAGEKEKREAYVQRMAKEEKERAHRLGQSHEERQRRQLQLNAERRRLEETRTLFQETKAKLDDLKESIHRQYAR